MDGAGSSSGGNVSSASQGTRPEYARQPNVKVNHFELKIQGKIVVYRYRVEIMEVDNDGQPLGESEDIWTSKKLRIFKEFARNELHNHHPIFDGQECFYSTIDLGLDQMEFVNESESNDGRRYKVRIHDKKKQEHSGHGTSLTSEFVQVLDVAIRCALSKKRKRIGRLLLHEEVDDHLVKIFGQQGLQPYRGILTSVRPGQSAMFLNVDTLLTGFYKTCPLTDLLPSSGNAGNTIDWQLDKDDMAFLKSLKGCKVEVKHLPYKRVRTIESITTKTAKEQELEEPSGSTRENKDRKIVAKNIAEYFNRYGGLRYPNLPCVKDVLVMGADVSHHSPNDSKPSVAAIVASIDDRASRYVAVIRPQEKANDKKRVEIILYMKSVVEELFGHYKKENPGKIPKHILLYRDGVSEGEFEKVRTHELADLQSACTEVFQCIPQITFLTVQKRHRTRFMRGHDSNVPPGTVVETTITRPADNEFFLCSHTPIQGTARPAHYRVIADDYGFKPETLQKITFSLCHMYARCVTPVSIPAPVYYAHLAAARASCYMKVTQVDTNPIIIEKDLRDQMFFI
ncbi:hypothetical protein HPB52_018454 [Rhipicephalus sanguineus]|uniref:Piwi domain-containing protein n=1 Tax=Rhipicephalus sanguineus TaxID=34632 RepID=A0A9D4ST59_RHISA|nr:hypothetical protein HPB52_018454 [Rhipicephalus sanguineus]